MSKHTNETISPQIRLDDEAQAQIEVIKGQMRAQNWPDVSITRTSAILFALANQAARGLTMSEAAKKVRSLRDIAYRQSRYE